MNINKLRRLFFGLHPKHRTYPALSWWGNYFGGHLCIGPVTIYGENAMHWAVNIRTRRLGYVCFRLPFRCFGRWWPLYFYCSPDGTPQSATFQTSGAERT